MLHRTVLAGLVVLALVPIASLAHAHTGVDAHATFSTGFLHPFGGLDHILAMIAVGLWAVQLGGRRLWLLPGAFVAALLVAASAGVGGLPIPVVEAGIAGSVALLGLAIALGAKAPTWAALSAVAIFGAFHGFAHGAEAPLAGSAALYVGGILVATAALHALGVGAGLAAKTAWARHAVRAAGAATAAVGGLMLAGAL